MRSSDWISAGLLIVLCGSAVRGGTGPSIPPPLAERLRIQEARVPQIEARAAEERTRVEQWYTARRAEIVREISRREAVRLSPAEQQAWVQYVDLYLARPHAPACADLGFNVRPETVFLNQAMILEYLTSRMAEILIDRDFERKLTRIVEERLDRPPLALLRHQARSLLARLERVRLQVTTGSRALEHQRNARLDAIMEWENDLKEQVRGILEYLQQSESRPAQFGVVQSVGYGVANGYFCMIEGVDRVLAVGDRIGNVRIQAIDPEKVEFAHNGITWTQPLGAPPQPYWD